MADEQEQEKTYEVKDKRRVNADGTIKEEVEEQQVSEEVTDIGAEAASGEGEPEEEEAELPMPTIYDLLQFMAGMLSEQAWQRMGIRLAPGQKESSKDLAQAKLAIDTMVFIADKLHPHIGEEERKALRALIGDLQINFVRQSQ